MRNIIALCAALGMVGVWTACGASDDEASASQQSALANGARPLEGQVAGHDEYGAPCGDGLGVTITSIGTGQVAHFGYTKMVSSACVEPDYTVSGAWLFTLTAANGDAAYGEVVDWAFTAYGFDLFATFTGGMGRFADITGEVKFPTMVTGPATWISTIEGWITY